MKRSSPSQPFPLLSWILFACLTAANSLLAFATLPIYMKMVIAIVGLAFPLGLGIFKRSKEGKEPFSLQNDLLPGIPLWILVLLALAAVFLRFHQLTTLSLWPHEDEAMNGHYAILLAEKGYWQWTYDFSAMPPLYIWGLGLFFKLFGVSLASLWAFPALLSALAVGFAYLGMRKFTSPSFSFFFAGLMALSFWPLYVARFSVQGGFLVFWECLTFYALGIFWEKRDWKSALALGLCAGAGFYTFTSWAVAAFALTLFLFEKTVLKPGRRWGLFLVFFLAESMLFAPLALLTGGNNAGHFQYVFQDPFQGNWIGFNDLFALFWGSRLSSNLFAYRPFWGGFLNPLLGGLCLWGVTALSRIRTDQTKARSHPTPSPSRTSGSTQDAKKEFFLDDAQIQTTQNLGKISGLFFLLILPGFLTGGSDAHRIVQVLPFLLFTAAAGLYSLASALPQARRWIFLGTMLLLSAGLDYHHLFGVYHALWVHPKGDVLNYKSMEYARAYGILNEVQKKEGSGVILSQLVPDTFDQSLAVATHPFNVLRDPDAYGDIARWAALLTNVHYWPYVKGQFPGSNCYWLSEQMGRPDGGMILVLIPLPTPQKALLERWIEADEAVAGIAGVVYANHDWKPRGPILEALQGFYFLFKGDPFLESCFWEKIAQNEYMDRHYEAQVEALQEALEKGTPAAHLYNDLGALYLRRDRLKEARACFEKALTCRPNYTSAAAGLSLAEDMEKNGKKPVD